MRKLSSNLIDQIFFQDFSKGKKKNLKKIFEDKNQLQNKRIN